MFRKHKEKKLREQQQHEAIDELRQLVARLPNSDGVISPDGLREFIEFVTAHDIDLNAVPVLRRDVRLGLAEGGFFLETNTSLLLKKDETPLLDVGVDLLKEVADRRFEGGSQGVSIPLGHGVRYRVGAYRGHMVTVGHHWDPADNGQLTVTDKRVVFRGRRKTLEFPFTKLATLNAYSDAIALGVATRQTTSTFGTGDPELVAGLIHAAVARQGDVTIIEFSYTA
jgi:hypothetical protein